MLGHNDEKGRLVPATVEFKGLDGAKIVSAACRGDRLGDGDRAQRPLHLGKSNMHGRANEGADRPRARA